MIAKIIMVSNTSVQNKITYGLVLLTKDI